MNLSTFIYDIYDEMKSVQKGLADNDAQQAGQLYRLILVLERTQAQLIQQTEKLKIYEKELRNDKEVSTAALNNLSQEKRDKQETCKELTKILASLKEMEKEIEKEGEDRRTEINSKFAEVLESIKGVETGNPEDNEKMRAENKELQESLEAIIENYNVKNNEYKAGLQELQDKFQETQSQAQEKILRVQEDMQELETVKAERNLHKAKADTTRGKISMYYEKVPYFYKMLEYKDTQYVKYAKEIKEIVHRYYQLFKEKLVLESSLKQLNEIYFQVHQEVC